MTRLAGLAFVAALAGGVVLSGEGSIDAKLQGQMKRLFPAAGLNFSPKEGNPPHYKVFTTDAKGVKTTVGFVFWTTELVPLERGYDGPIKMLVGMDTKAILTGIIVTEHHEPYGNFSVEPPEFAAQFKNKNIRDAFKPGDDIDAVSRATISVTSAARAVRNASRRIAREYLTPEGVK